MVRKIHYGIVGYGLEGMGHQNELENHPKLAGRTKLIVGFDPNPDRMKSLEKNKSIKLTNNFDDLLNTPGLEAIIISSPPQFHAEQAITALESGLHVFSEIPMSINEKDIQCIIDAEDSSGKCYQLGENYCFYSEVLYAGHLASSGEIGPTVYAESEYLHDVTYRWRNDRYGDIDTPRVDSWYQLFDPIMYAHSIGPAQVALGGLKTPMPFIETTSYANDIGGYQGHPICSPAKAFQVALFKSNTGAIAKCANAYIFAREPTRHMIQVVGRTGTYECYQIGKPGQLFLADGHKINKRRHRKGNAKIIDREYLSKEIEPVSGFYYGASVRIRDDWLIAIEKKKKSTLHARVGGNFCMAGIAASKSARSGGKPVSIKVFSD